VLAVADVMSGELVIRVNFGIELGARVRDSTNLDFAASVARTRSSDRSTVAGSAASCSVLAAPVLELCCLGRKRPEDAAFFA
jgi:hypothetical protein